MEKYGFVYIWYDKWQKKFYVGCHWGHENDGYVCSSNRMRKAYRRRPQDFKRRIISKIYDRSQLLDEEYKWLRLIPETQLGKRYYNLKKHHYGHWANSDSRMTVSEKLAQYTGEKSSMYGRKHSDETKLKMSKAARGKQKSEEHKQKIKLINVGRTHSEETKEKMRKSHNRDYSDPEFKRKMSIAAKNRSAETRKKISDNMKRLNQEGKVGTSGLRHSEDAKKRISETNKLTKKNNPQILSEETRKKISDSCKRTLALKKQNQVSVDL